jgi:hypothetical protein
MDPGKLDMITQWPYPESVCHLQKFLGFTNFYRKFIHRFSEITAPLTELTKKGVDVRQGLKGDLCLSTLSRLKACFTKAPLLAHFDFAKVRVLFVDSSKYAIAGVLCQPDEDGNLHPVSFLSRKLTSRKALWQVHDQELFAIISAFTEWRSWLIDTNEPVLVMSDHANLRYFMANQHLSDRQARWASFLSSFHFVIKHVSGTRNPADPPTRRPDFITDDGREEHFRTLLRQEKGNVVMNGKETGLEDAEVCDVGQDNTDEPPDLLADHMFCQPTQRLRDILRHAYEKDPPVVDDDDESPLRFEQGFWWLKDWIFVPTELRPLILQTFHDDISAGHLGSLKTLQNITRSLTWPGIRGDVIRYTKSCLSCQRAKHSNQRPPGLMVSLAIPERPWSVIGIDFIVKLPLSSGFDSILVIVDHFSKAAHFIPGCETWAAEDFANVFLDRFIRYHGLPDKIVSDRGSVFVSRFWTEVQRLLRIKPAPSTAWHPRTDGQTERANQTVETYIRHFISDRQDDWAALLPMAELVFNTSVSASTGFSPFFAQFSFHPRMNTLSAGSLVPAADSLVERLNEVQEGLKQYLKRAKEVQKEYFDRRARDSPSHSEGDWVWLLRTNITSKRPSEKLDFKRLGPFKITEEIGKEAFRLSLPPDMKRIHPVFHSSLLVPFVDPKSYPGRRVPTSSLGRHLTSHRDIDENDVEAIIGYRKMGSKKHEYLVSWRNGSAADNSWVKGGHFAETIHPYLERFHDNFGTQPIILSSDKAVWILC